MVKKKVKINPEHFRVAIFGSARIKQRDPRYKLVFQLAKMIAEEGMDIVTGGGPGLMDAASRGHLKGRKNKDVHSVGLTIQLPREQRDSYHLDIKEQFHKFSNRLDTFMKLSNAVVVAPGGLGTLLECFYAWQLVQVHKICDMPIILLGGHYQMLLNWIKKEIMSKRLVNKEDFDFIFVAKNCTEVMAILKKCHIHYLKKEHACERFEKYKQHL